MAATGIDGNQSVNGHDYPSRCWRDVNGSRPSLPADVLEPQLHREAHRRGRTRVEGNGICGPLARLRHRRRPRDILAHPVPGSERDSRPRPASLGDPRSPQSTPGSFSIAGRCRIDFDDGISLLDRHDPTRAPVRADRSGWSRATAPAAVPGDAAALNLDAIGAWLGEQRPSARPTPTPLSRVHREAALALPPAGTSIEH